MTFVDIHKVGGILIQNRRLLVCRAKGKEHFIAPGGKIEVGETALQALQRELTEELSIHVEESQFKPFGVFEAQAAGAESKKIRMEVFLVSEWHGEVKGAHEIEALAWVSSLNEEKLKLGSIFEHEVIPRLKAELLID